VTITEESTVTSDGSGSGADVGSAETAQRPDVSGAPLLADPIDPAGPAGEALTGRRIGRAAGEFVLAALVAAVVSLVVLLVIDRIHYARPSFVGVAMTSLTSVVLLAAALWLVSRGRWGRRADVASWVGLSVLNTAVLGFMLDGSKFYLGGISSDQSFRTEYFTRLTDSVSVKDFAFLNVPSYYPSGWFWLGGRFANVLGLAGWEAYKPFAIMTIAVAAALAYTGWSLVVTRRVAVLLALATSTVGVATWAAYEPYAWIWGALIPPMAAVAWKYLTGLLGRGEPAEGSARWAPGVLLGVYIGLLALFYTLLFLFFTMLVVLTALVGLVLHWRERRRSGPVLRQAVLRVLLVGVVALPVMLVHWAPYLLGTLDTPVRQSAASAILPEFGGQFPVPIGLSDFIGLLSLAGLVWMIVRARDGVVAKSLLLVLVAGYLWYGVSMLGIPAKMTLLPYKIELVMDETLRCAGVLALLDGARWLALRLRGKYLRWQRTALVSVAVIGLLGTVGVLQSAADPLSPLPDQAFSDYYPTGYTALGGHDPTQDGAWNQQLHDTIAQLTGKPENQSVVLSNYQDFLSFWPYWNFETSIIEYANPLADFYTRSAAIQSWAKAGSPAQLLGELNDPRFATPNVFVFTRKADGLHLTVTRNNFPVYPQIVATDVVFPTALFDSPDFVSRDVGPFTVVVRR
jgi:galactan 5-O-arabinofuranosyltransferase